MAKYVAFAFQSETDRNNALTSISDKYCDLQTNTAEQILDRGYNYVLFVEDRSSLTFNLTLAALAKEHGGVLRDKVRI